MALYKCGDQIIDTGEIENRKLWSLGGVPCARYGDSEDESDGAGFWEIFEWDAPELLEPLLNTLRKFLYDLRESYYDSGLYEFLNDVVDAIKKSNVIVFIILGILLVIFLFIISKNKK